MKLRVVFWLDMIFLPRLTYACCLWLEMIFLPRLTYAADLVV